MKKFTFGIDVSSTIQMKQSKEYYSINKMEKFSSSYLYVDCVMNKLYFLHNDPLRDAAADLLFALIIFVISLIIKFPIYSKCP